MTHIKGVLLVLGVGLTLCGIYCVSHETPLPYLSKYMSSWTAIFVGIGTVVGVTYGRPIAVLLWFGAALMSLFYFIKFLFFKDAFVSAADWMDALKIVGSLTAGGIVFWIFGIPWITDGGDGGSLPQTSPSTPLAPPPERIMVCRFCGRQNAHYWSRSCPESPHGRHELI